MRSNVRLTLAAVVCVACGSSQPPPRAPLSNAEAPVASADPEECDGFEERVCGSVEGDSCAARGDGLLDVDVRDLIFTDITADAPLEARDRPELRKFALDAPATRTYREQLTQEGELSASRVASHCCYSRCAPLSEDRSETALGRPWR
jgi:hypothetical protein